MARTKAIDDNILLCYSDKKYIAYISNAMLLKLRIQILVTLWFIFFCFFALYFIFLIPYKYDAENVDQYHHINNLDSIIIENYKEYSAVITLLNQSQIEKETPLLLCSTPSNYNHLMIQNDKYIIYYDSLSSSMFFAIYAMDIFAQLHDKEQLCIFIEAHKKIRFEYLYKCHGTLPYTLHTTQTSYNIADIIILFDEYNKIIATIFYYYSQEFSNLLFKIIMQLFQ